MSIHGTEEGLKVDTAEVCVGMSPRPGVSCTVKNPWAGQWTRAVQVTERSGSPPGPGRSEAGLSSVPRPPLFLTCGMDPVTAEG